MRTLLKFLMVAGVVLMLLGPFKYIANKGSGGPSGPASVSLQWRRASDVLMPCGALLTLCAGAMLVAIDRKLARSPKK